MSSCPSPSSSGRSLGSGSGTRSRLPSARASGLGGPVPLGYRSVGKKLEVVPEDAALVRKIFADYVRLGSIGELAAALDKEGIRPKPRYLANGTAIAAERFMVGPLAHLLKNRFYVGEVVHKGEVHKGEHEPILDRDLFEAGPDATGRRKFSGNSRDRSRLRF